MFETSDVRNAAVSELRNLGRFSFSSDGFTQEEIHCIADAITAAIEAYDKSRNQQKLFLRTKKSLFHWFFILKNIRYPVHKFLCYFFNFISLLV